VAGIRQTAQGLIRLIDRFLDFDYLRSGVLLPQRTWGPAKALVERQLGLLQGLIDAKSLRVEVQVSEQARLFADQALLSEVVANLLGNAVKASPSGGRLRVRWAEPSGLWVEDEGPGFGKLPAGGRGTGLGLDHCREILKAHGGRLDIGSPSSGARVGFSLPAAGPRVLLVDDQPVQRRLLTEELQRIWPSCQVLAAGDGLAGWTAMRRERPDLVILDRAMPRMDGLTLMERLRKDAQTQAVPVLMVSSVASLEEEASVARACLATGADAFLPKPVDPARLEALVSSLLSADDDA
jgi:CheY-like chemotaxis protein